MKRILVTGSGGAATLSFCRSLRDANEQYYLVGVDAGKYSIHRSEVDRAYLCPKAQDDNYIDYINHIIEKENIDFIHSQPEIELWELSKHRDQLKCKHFMPKHETVALLRDKFESYRIWSLYEDIKTPKTFLINDEVQLYEAFQILKHEVWLRDTTGAAGRGSLSRPSFELARTDLYARNAWGKTIVSEHLTDKTITWQSIWHHGELVVGQGRKRMYWEFANRTQSGVTGLTGTGVIIKDRELADLAIKCIEVADRRPNGIYSVDFTFDWDGIPNPTEINIGKFFTTHLFITSTGCNMPEIFVKLAFEEYEGEWGIVDPCDEDFYWIRGIDKLPRLVHQEEIDHVMDEYTDNLKEMR